MTIDRRPLACGSYHAGHQVHFIQVLSKLSEPDPPPQPGTLLEADTSGLLVVELEGERVSLWNHEPDRLAFLAGEHRNEITVQRRRSLLRIGRGGIGGPVFSIADPHHAHPCGFFR